MEEVTEIQVFISCPGDVEPEKNIVEKVCESVNRSLVNSGIKVRFRPRYWKEIIGYFGPRPQEIINTKINNYDIYIGLLWMRFGTPPGANNPATGDAFDSGTEEEFYFAYDKWKEDKNAILIYVFFKQPVATNTYEENVQHGKVLKFKEQIQQFGWVNPMSEDFHSQLYEILIPYANEVVNRKYVAEKKLVKADQDDQSLTGPSSFTKGVYDVTDYVARTISRYTSPSNEQYTNHNKSEGNLIEMVGKEKRIVLLGNAGSGKSIELVHLANYFSNDSTPYIPIYKRLNTYAEEDIEAFLPEGWHTIPEALMLIILDGLDEIQPKHFDTAIRKLLTFSEKYASARIVVSSRTNFFELPDESSLGTLPDFTIYFLDEILLSDVGKYANCKYGLDGLQFIKEAREEGYFDLLFKPFFLKLLLEIYQKEGNISGGRPKVLDHFIKSRLKLDSEHFRTTYPVRAKSNEALLLLEEVAFVMEAQGVNYIKEEDLRRVITKSEDFQLITFTTAFTKKIGEDAVWQFEHNNIQEYLAARFLTRCPIEEIKNIITVGTNLRKVKPTWVNTLSFLFSILEQGQALRDLTDWLTDEEPEVLVKFEPDRIPVEKRFDIFKTIISFYKQNDIWLTSNKFSKKDLASFSESDIAFDYLTDELSDVSNSFRVLINGLLIIRHYKLNPIQKHKVKDILIQLLNIENQNAYLIYEVLSSLSKMSINDKNTIETVIALFKHRKNQYVRTGLYQLIKKSHYLDEYIDFFIEGIIITDKEKDDDREDTNFSEESLNLKDGLTKASTPEAIMKILGFLSSHKGRRIRFYEKKEILSKIIENAVSAFREEKGIFDGVIGYYLCLGRTYDREAIPIIPKFFKETGTTLKAFKAIWGNVNLSKFDHEFLLTHMLNEETLEYVFQLYEKHDATNEQIISLFNRLKFYQKEKEISLLEKFELWLRHKTTINVGDKEKTDVQRIAKERHQAAFDILFEPSQFEREVRRIFAEIGKEEIAFDDLWEIIKGNHEYDIEDYFISTPIDLLRNFSNATLSVILRFIQNQKRFEFYRIQRIVKILENNKDIQVSEKQVEFIETWCNDNIMRTPIATEEGNITYAAEAIWVLINRFQFELPANKLLDYTLCSYLTTDNESRIDTLEKHAPIDQIKARVLSNLKNGINASGVWEANSYYAIQSGIAEAFPIIMQDIISGIFRDNDKVNVLESYLAKTGDYQTIRRVLLHSNSDTVVWKAAELLESNKEEHSFLIGFLENILKNDSHADDYKLTAASRLIRLNILSGLVFYGNFILQKEDPNIDFHYSLYSVRNFTHVEAVPLLLKLLKLSKQPQFQNNDFNRLDSSVLEALHSIALSSEENLKTVTEYLKCFIEENKNTINHITFLYNNIDRMEFEFYSRNDHNLSLDQALRMVRQFKPS